MGEKRKHKLKKRTAKMTFKIFIRRILGIPLSLTVLYVKLPIKLLKFFKKKSKDR